MFAKQTGQMLRYDKMLVELGAFEESVRAFFDSGGKGLNVTVPFKEDAARFADHLTQRAQLAGAVNTLAVQDDGRILGDTTDGAGLISDLIRLDWPLTSARVLVVGAGGAVRGVVQPLLEHGVQSLTITNRTLSKAQQLSALFAPFGDVQACSLESTADGGFDLVINGTSAGLSGGVPLLPEAALRDTRYAYDMIYASEPTAFLRWAARQGVASCSDGLGMLVGQAAESFFIWRSVRPQCESVIAALRQRI